MLQGHDDQTTSIVMNKLIYLLKLLLPIGKVLFYLKVVDLFHIFALTLVLLLTFNILAVGNVNASTNIFNQMYLKDKQQINNCYCSFQINMKFYLNIIQENM